MTKKGKEWKNSEQYPHLITVRLTEEQNHLLDKMPNKSEYIRILLDAVLKY